MDNQNLPQIGTSRIETKEFVYNGCINYEEIENNDIKIIGKLSCGNRHESKIGYWEGYGVIIFTQIKEKNNLIAITSRCPFAVRKRLEEILKGELKGERPAENFDGEIY